VVGQARRFSREIAAGIKRCTEIIKQAILEGLRQGLDEIIRRVRQVMHQTKARIFADDTRSGPKTRS
jgi:IS5 family transposase